MTKQLRAMIDAENERRGKQYPQIGALTTFTRGFGQKDDLRIGTIMNEGGGVMSECAANVPAFRKFLLRNQQVNGKGIWCYQREDCGWDKYTVVYLESTPEYRDGQIYRECVGLSGHSTAIVGDHLGKMVMFDTLPKGLQATVHEDLK